MLKIKRGTANTHSILEKIKEEAPALLDLTTKLHHIIDYQNSEVLANRQKIKELQTTRIQQKAKD